MAFCSKDPGSHPHWEYDASASNTPSGPLSNAQAVLQSSYLLPAVPLAPTWAPGTVYPQKTASSLPTLLSSANLLSRCSQGDQCCCHRNFWLLSLQLLLRFWTVVWLLEKGELNAWSFWSCGSRTLRQS